MISNKVNDRTVLLVYRTDTHPVIHYSAATMIQLHRVCALNAQAHNLRASCHIHMFAQALGRSQCLVCGTDNLLNPIKRNTPPHTDTLDRNQIIRKHKHADRHVRRKWVSEYILSVVLICEIIGWRSDIIYTASFYMWRCYYRILSSYPLYMLICISACKQNNSIRF